MSAIGFARDSNVEQITHEYYVQLKREVVEGNPYLSDIEQAALRSHHEVMMNPDRYPPKLATQIYAARRSPAAKAILETASSCVFDAGCGFGSESFFFAALGAKVIAADISETQISTARKRQKYYEELFRMPLNISFQTADLNNYTPDTDELSFTWLASVLAAIEDQDAFLRRVNQCTRDHGKVLVTDMNLLNPLFLFGEWKRRKRAAAENQTFAKNANFLEMLFRKGRRGARYYGQTGKENFDDVQFFYPRSLSRLFAATGFSMVDSAFHGFKLPLFPSSKLVFWERTASRLPILQNFGYFYSLIGIKSTRD